MNETATELAAPEWVGNAATVGLTMATCTLLSLAFLEDKICEILGAKQRKGDAKNEIHLGAFYYSHGKGAAAMATFVCACALEVNGDRILQPIWDACLSYGQPYVSHQAFGGTLATLSFVLICTYFTYLDLTHSPTKVQKDYWPSSKDLWDAAWPQLLAYTAGQVATWYPWMLDPASQSIELPHAAPPLWRFGAEFVTITLAGDFLIYWHHRIMHIVPYFRNHLHNVHHTYSACFSWAGGWVHPIEDGLVVGCQIIPIVAVAPHPIVLWLFSIFWVICLVDEHSGHDMWWSPYQLLPLTGCPLGGGATPHDIHHYKPTVNYGFIFCIWDHMFGTFEEPKAQPYNPFVEPLNRERKKKNKITAK